MSTFIPHGIPFTGGPGQAAPQPLTLVRYNGGAGDALQPNGYNQDNLSDPTYGNWLYDAHAVWDFGRVPPATTWVIQRMSGYCVKDTATAAWPTFLFYDGTGLNRSQLIDSVSTSSNFYRQEWHYPLVFVAGQQLIIGSTSSPASDGPYPVLRLDGLIYH